jgi:hypothetical protein
VQHGQALAEITHSSFFPANRMNPDRNGVRVSFDLGGRHRPTVERGGLGRLILIAFRRAGANGQAQSHKKTNSQIPENSFHGYLLLSFRNRAKKNRLPFMEKRSS